MCHRNTGFDVYVHACKSNTFEINRWCIMYAYNLSSELYHNDNHPYKFFQVFTIKESHKNRPKTEFIERYWLDSMVNWWIKKPTFCCAPDSTFWHCQKPLNLLDNSKLFNHSAECIIPKAAWNKLFVLQTAMQWMNYLPLLVSRLTVNQLWVRLHATDLSFSSFLARTWNTSLWIITVTSASHLRWAIDRSSLSLT